MVLSTPPPPICHTVYKNVDYLHDRIWSCVHLSAANLAFYLTIKPKYFVHLYDCMAQGALMIAAIHNIQKTCFIDC